MTPEAEREPPDRGAAQSSSTDAEAGEAPGSSSAGPDGPAEDSPPPTSTSADADVDEGTESSEQVDAGEVDGELLLAEHDRFKDLALRAQAELENFRKAQIKRQTELVERANQGLVESLLPVLDNFDLARTHDHSETVDQLWASLWGTLEAEGLARIDDQGAPFDPNLHEAVSHEEGDETDGPVVASVMRTGYLYKGRVLRAAMVSVRG